MEEKKHKRKYENAELDIILLKMSDIVTASEVDDGNVSDDDWT